MNNSHSEDKRNCTTANLEYKKRKHQIVTPDLAEAIVDVRAFFENEKQQNKRIAVNRVVERTAQALQVLASTVVKVTKKVNGGEGFKVHDTRHHDMAVPEKMVLVVQATIMQMYKEKIHVTLDSLLLKLKSQVATRQSAWHWARATLHRFLTNKMSFFTQIR